MKRLPLWVGMVLVAVVVGAGALAVVWTPYDPTQVQPHNRFADPSWVHPLGTDNYGIDLVSRLMAGAKVCLLVGIIAVTIAAVGGVPLGIIAAMTASNPSRRARLQSEAIMRASDILYAFPALLLAILLAAAFGSSMWTAMTAIGIATIPAFTRMSRAGTLQVLSQDYVLAARAAGTGRFTIAGRHILPNIAPILGVQASVSFALAILAEAGLSYLGLGSPPDVPTWGRMLKDAQVHLFNEPTLALWPGLAIGLAVLGFNLLGDGLREVLDPRLRETADRVELGQ